MRVKRTRDLPNRGNICIGGLGAMLLAGSIALCPRLLIAQTTGQLDNPVRVGDRSTYATKDEITGLPTETYTHVVTEISPTQIVISASTQGSNGSRPIVFDSSWNRVEGRGIRFKPHNGMGISSPLVVGKEWRTEYEARNVQTGAAWKESAASMVVAQEAITTPAGTFDSFKIETRTHEINAKDPAQFRDYEHVRWYAPQINHWVRWVAVTRSQRRLTQSRSEELIELGRKE
jgi:hypothetical protein